MANTLHRAAVEALKAKRRAWLTRTVSFLSRLASLVQAIEVRTGFQTSAI